jgi:hypothetical protein
MALFVLKLIYSVFCIWCIVKFAKYLEKLFHFQPKEKLVNFNDELIPVNTKFQAAKINKTYIDRDGYKRFTDSDRLVHRWVMEKYLKRKLSYEEVVHHIDGDKQNNKPGNLRLFANQAEHDKFHRDHFRNFGTWHEEIPDYTVYHGFKRFAN